MTLVRCSDSYCIPCATLPDGDPGRQPPDTQGHRCWPDTRGIAHARNKCLSPVVRELGRDCAFTTSGADGRTGYKLRGRVFKGRRMPGDHAEWVVLEPVHQAVDVLRQLNDDPGHLFGYAHGSLSYLASAVSARLAAFRDDAVSLFSQDGGPFIPYDGDQPWALSSRQFRRIFSA